MPVIHLRLWKPAYKDMLWAQDGHQLSCLLATSEAQRASMGRQQASTSTARQAAQHPVITPSIQQQHRYCWQSLVQQCVDYNSPDIRSLVRAGKPFA